MKPVQNKIIRAACFVLAASTLLCACSKQPDNKETTTSAQEETTTAAPVTQQPTTESTTAEPTTVTAAPTTTAAATTAKPVTTAPVTLPPQTTVPETTTVIETTTLNAIQSAGKIAGYYFLTPDQIKQTASDLAEESEVYYVRLQDGSNTFYIAVDLQTAEALSLANPQVLRELCRELEKKQQSMAESDEEYVLMDYRHLVGELEIHYVGYLLTGALGGESGPLASFYNSCKVADLNVDESRFGPIIDIIGVIYG